MDGYILPGRPHVGKGGVGESREVYMAWTGVLGPGRVYLGYQGLDGCIRAREPGYVPVLVVPCMTGPS